MIKQCMCFVYKHIICCKYCSLSVMGFLETGGGRSVRGDTAGITGIPVEGTPFGFGLVE